MKRKWRSKSEAKRIKAISAEPFQLTLEEVMRDLDPGWEVWQKPGREFQTRSTL